MKVIILGKKYIPTDSLLMIVSYILAIIISTIVAYFSWRFIEEPINNWRRKR